MATSGEGALVVVSCDEQDPRIDPSRYFNLTAQSNSVIKVAGGRAAYALSALHATDAASRIGMIVVVQHTGCTRTTGDTEQNVRADIQSLQTSPYLRHDIPIIGYLLDVTTSQLREVTMPVTGADAQQRAQGQMEDFGPFWG